MPSRATLILTGFCLTITACDSTPTGDTAAGETRLPAPESRSLRAPGSSIVRRDGKLMVLPRRAPVSLLRGNVSALVAGTTQCDLGEIVPELDENGIPIPDHFELPAPLPADTYDAIEVPPDGVCVLDGVTVLQSITAFANARLFIHGSEVGGDVIGLSATVIQVAGDTHIGGDLDMQDAHDDLTLPFASCAVTHTTIAGDLSCTNSNPGSVVIRPTISSDGEGGTPTTVTLPVLVGGSVNLLNNVILPGHVQLLQGTEISGKAEVNDNTGGGYKEVTNNHAGQKVSCKRNTATFVGGPNPGGKAKGQCF